MFYLYFFFFKQKTAYEMRISDWSSDVCSSDLTMRNEQNVPLKVYWIHGHEEKFTQNLAPLGSIALNTFPSHSFVIRSADGAMVKAFQITGPDRKRVV